MLPFDVPIQRAVAYGLFACLFALTFTVLGFLQAARKTRHTETPSKRDVLAETLKGVGVVIAIAITVVIVGYVLAVLEQVVLL